MGVCLIRSFFFSFWVLLCGNNSDGAGMAKAVNESLVQVLEQAGGLQPAVARQAHADLLTQRRLLFDVW